MTHISLSGPAGLLEQLVDHPVNDARAPLRVHVEVRRQRAGREAQLLLEQAFLLCDHPEVAAVHVC